MAFRKVDGKDNVFARIGIFGRAGSGKTRTATEIATGLCKDSGGAIYMIDTEGVGSDFAAKYATAAGVEIFAEKTHEFEKLPDIIREACDAKPGCIIVDSISHFWDNIQDQYRRDVGRDGELQMRDWKAIKDMWRTRFARLFLSVPANIIICGRESTIYRPQRNNKGKWEQVAVGTKMKAESETEYEPSLLIHMFLSDDGVNRAFVKKDRSGVIQGKYFDYPKYGDFAGHLKWLNPGGTHRAIEESIVSGKLFSDVDEADKQRAMIISEIRETLDSIGLSGKSKSVLKAKGDLFEKVFGTRSSSKIFHEASNDELIAGIEKIKKEVNDA